MRIGLVSYEYPPQRGLGGVGTYTYRLAGALGRLGHRVNVLAGPTEDADHEQPNVSVHRIPARYDPPIPFKSVRWLYWQVLARTMGWANPLVWHWLRWDLATGAALREIDRKSPLDVIEAPEHAANGLIAGRAQQWPLVVRVHGPWDLFFGINRTQGAVLNRLLAFLERQSTSYAQTVTTPSKTMAQFIEHRWQLPRRPKVIANFMDVPAARTTIGGGDGIQRITCVGRIERFKGQDILVKAFAKIARHHPSAQLVLMGPDQWSPHQTFSQVADQLVPDPNVRRRIQLPGPQPLRMVQEMLGKSTVAVVCSSGFESFSFSTLEAMAAARPIVASRSGAIPELLDEGRCGVLVPPGDEIQLADALNRLLSDRALSDELAGCAHDRAKAKYDTSVLMPAFVETFAKAQEAVTGRTELFAPALEPAPQPARMTA